MDPVSISSAKCKDSFCFALVSRVLVFAANGRLSAGESVTPYQAYTIDIKMDDGKPRTGTVLGGSTGNGLGQGFTLYHIPNGLSNTRCTSSQVMASVENEYKFLDSDEGNEVRCLMNFIYK